MSQETAHAPNGASAGNVQPIQSFTDTGPGVVGAGWDGSTFGFELPSPVHSLQGNVSMLDSAVFRTMFGSDKMRAIMSDRAYVKRLVEVEVALAKVEGDLGIIPKEAAEAIAKYADASKINLERMRHETDIVGYSILPVIRQLVEMCGASGKYIHVGFNTQDIHDLAVSLQIKAGLDLIEEQLNATRLTLVKLCKEHKTTVMMGRTHLQHALPVTFGYKCAVYLASLDRHAERLERLRPRALLASIGGASGSLGSMGMGTEKTLPDGVRTITAICEYLGLTDPDICIHVTRDHIVEIINFLAMVAGSLGKIAYDVMLMSAQEIAEVKEPFIPHRGASSTMPHKRNPISSEIIMAIARITRSHASTTMDTLVSDFERATGPWHLEFVTIPETFTYTCNSLVQTNFILSNMKVDVKRMTQNLQITQGLNMAEHVMVGIADKVGRVQAHDIIYEDCKRCIETGQPLADFLKVNPEVTKYLTAEEIAWRMEPRNYLGSCLAWVDKVVKDR